MTRARFFQFWFLQLRFPNRQVKFRAPIQSMSLKETQVWFFEVWFLLKDSWNDVSKVFLGPDSESESSKNDSSPIPNSWFLNWTQLKCALPSLAGKLASCNFLPAQGSRRMRSCTCYQRTGHSSVEQNHSGGKKYLIIYSSKVPSKQNQSLLQEG